MAQSLSRHLWSAAILAGSAIIALAAERLSAPRARRDVVASELAVARDIEPFIRHRILDSIPAALHWAITMDPFDNRRSGVEQTGVASPGDARTVPSSSVGGRRLTAVLVADDRRVAVIDDAAVSVGDVLPDGARVSAIQPDRVWVTEKDGRWRVLTLTNRGIR